MQPNRFAMARAYGIYDQSLEKAIHQYKYNERIWLARPFSLLLFSTFIKYWDINDVDIITPVPLHIKRFRQRGFNQAYMMFRKWPQMARKMNIDISHIQFVREIVIRTRATESQVGMDHKERTKNLKGAFEARNLSKINGSRIVLVDDVFTTGSAANECAREMLRHGAGRLTFSHSRRLPKRRGLISEACLNCMTPSSLYP
ncbi:hypothetical protein QUF72_22020 [Desulfobacterales bacterium HSG2]|nr:hypothetical protein [Desulfobacterales bacterium HSG2]